MATEHPISVVASEFFYIVVFLHGITLGYPTQKLLTFLIPALAKVSISCKYRKKEEENAMHFPLYFKARRILLYITSIIRIVLLYLQ